MLAGSGREIGTAHKNCIWMEFIGHLNWENDLGLGKLLSMGISWR